MNRSVSKALSETFAELAPFSRAYRVDFDRYHTTLSMLVALPAIAGKRVLDIGTGIGIIPVALRKLGIQADGLDRYIFPDAKNEMFGRDNITELQSVWERYGVTVHNKNILDASSLAGIPHAEAVVSEALIEHLKDPRSFIENCRALLTPGGYLLLATPNAATLLKRIRFLFGRSPNWPIESFFKDGEAFTGHWREYTLQELRYMCEAGGFEVIEMHSKNLLTKFKGLGDVRKNLRALVASVSALLPHGREMNYVLCRKR